MAGDVWECRVFQDLLDTGLLAIGDGYRAKNEELDGTGPIFLRAGHVTDTHIDFAGVERFRADLANRVEPKMAVVGDTIMTTKGNSTGRTSFVTSRMPPFVYSPHLSYWRSLDHNRLAPGFLRYWSQGKEFVTQLEGMKASTDMAPYLSLTDQKRLRITLPSATEQKAIAHILGTLDDKIELNRRMNETLEAMARAIFKSWFVDFDPVRAKMAGRKPEGMDAATAKLFPDGFTRIPMRTIPNGWTVANPKDLMGFVIGGDWGKDTPDDEFSAPVYCIRGADIPDLQVGGLGKMPTRYIKPSSLDKRGLRAGDLAFEISGGSPTQSTGRPVLITAELLERLGQPLTSSNFCRLIRPSEICRSHYLYLLLRHLYECDEFLQFENGTTGIKNFAFTVFCENYSIIVPPLSLQQAFERLMSPLFALHGRNGIQATVLQDVRDTLLPQLLSGEISTSKAEKVLNRAI